MEIFNLPIAIMMTISGILFLWYQPRYAKEVRQKIENQEINEIEGNKSIRFSRFTSIIFPIVGICLLIEALLLET
jgi:mannose/fructose/N-acetylgalactosamine-specific phosphotransferase system component IIC